MDDKILQNFLEYITTQESKKIVGKVCKRFELESDKAIKQKRNYLTLDEVENIKKQTKELLYEWTRDLRDSIKNGKVILKFTNKRKEGANNG